ncbi:MAG: glycoside hydrolase family 5 protein [Pseudomonadota bacterium]
MKLGRRQIVLSSLALMGGCGGGGVRADTPASAPNNTSLAPPQRASRSIHPYPNYNTSPLAPDASGMPSTATEIATRIKAAWNAGNTLEAIGGETAWGNPQITRELINFVKASGFDAVRLPCSWDQYSNQSTAAISATWLDRVKQVVQYCIDADLYVLLNIHWDGGWLETHVDTASKYQVALKQRAFWEQIATHLRDFDERLMFASANEPAVETAEQMGVLSYYHQTFVDAVRSTGGRNAYRTLVVQGPSTNIDRTDTLWTAMPTDPAANRLMAEVHFYDPYQFTIMPEDQSWGLVFYYWGRDFHSTIQPSRNATWGEEDFVTQEMAKMKSKFVDAGVPVILGEYGLSGPRSGVAEPNLHLASRAHWMKTVTQQALANGVLPFFWDTGGLIDRRNLTILDQAGLDALMEGAGKK